MPIHLEPGPDNVHWGYFDARLTPRVTVDSGDRLTISTVSGGPDLMPTEPLKVPPARGMISTAPPRKNGGNLDNKELVAGSTLYLPIFVPGALFSVGDGHGVQGDGEVCVTAVETGLTGTFRLTLRDDMRLEWPMAETPMHVITMAFDPDLDDCVVIALRQMLDLICTRTGLDRYQAYSLASLAADVRVTQVVNGNKGIPVMLPKRYLTRGKVE